MSWCTLVSQRPRPGAVSEWRFRWVPGGPWRPISRTGTRSVEGLGLGLGLGRSCLSLRRLLAVVDNSSQENGSRRRAGVRTLRREMRGSNSRPWVWEGRGDHPGSAEDRDSVERLPKNPNAQSSGESPDGGRHVIPCVHGL